jgi:hypothetical protein
MTHQTATLTFPRYTDQDVTGEQYSPIDVPMTQTQLQNILAVLRAIELHREPQLSMSLILDLREKFEYFEYKARWNAGLTAEDWATD